MEKLIHDEAPSNQLWLKKTERYRRYHPDKTWTHRPTDTHKGKHINTVILPSPPTPTTQRKTNKPKNFVTGGIKKEWYEMSKAHTNSVLKCSSKNPLTWEKKHISSSFKQLRVFKLCHSFWQSPIGIFSPQLEWSKLATTFLFCTVAAWHLHCWKGLAPCTVVHHEMCSCCVSLHIIVRITSSSNFPSPGHSFPN